jgi:hypothetical protein
MCVHFVKEALRMLRQADVFAGDDMLGMIQEQIDRASTAEPF